jgi:hypothetical protein
LRIAVKIDWDVSADGGLTNLEQKMNIRYGRSRPPRLLSLRCGPHRRPRLLAERVLADVNSAVDRKMVKVDAAYRARTFALDLERLETLTTRCLEAVAKGSLQAGHLLLKTLERCSAMLGSDAPMRLDVTEIAGPRETSTSELRRVFEELRGKRSDEPPSLPN